MRRSWRAPASRASRALAAGRTAEAVELYRHAIERGPGPSAPPREVAAFASVLHDLGRALDYLGETSAALDALHQAHDLLADASPNAPELVGILRRLGAISLEAGDQDGALAALERAVASAAQDPGLAAAAELELGFALRDVGRLAEALVHLERALRLDDSSAVRAHALVGIGLVFEAARRPGAAHARYQAALPLYQRMGDRHNEATVRYRLGIVCGLRGSFADALASLDAALDLDRGLRSARASADQAVARAALAAADGDRGQAVTYLRHALDLYRAEELPFFVARTLIGLARLVAPAESAGWAERANDERSAAWRAEAEMVASELTEPGSVYDVRLGLGDLYRAAGDRDAARTAWLLAASVAEAVPGLPGVEAEEVAGLFGVGVAFERLASLAAEEGDAAGSAIWRSRAAEVGGSDE
ncbi:tetratricopeptide repeat protein [Cryptosporangium phraense]|uniref:tetratricopeptide repeat protein n=1 Tax=Cryptosporangium phraense TaxID=2593070 RepID=UPI00147888F0|nr:tetratricopeptide repeat protein [Cryptosporangium phraense]